jgi:hypothetical protein
MRKLNNVDYKIKCNLCKNTVSQLDYRHVYDGICFQCITDILYFFENYDPVEFDSACDYAKRKSKGERTND